MLGMVAAEDVIGFALAEPNRGAFLRFVSSSGSHDIQIGTVAEPFGNGLMPGRGWPKDRHRRSAQCQARYRGSSNRARRPPASR